tara:strand:- start:2 stop:190 length:189 start_codon:yes stop_codon:yes gene_type:complete
MTSVQAVLLGNIIEFIITSVIARRCSLLQEYEANVANPRTIKHTTVSTPNKKHPVKHTNSRK